jgi:hypothetical protein
MSKPCGHPGMSLLAARHCRFVHNCDVQLTRQTLTARAYDLANKRYSIQLQQLLESNEPKNGIRLAALPFPALTFEAGP